MWDFLNVFLEWIQILCGIKRKNQRIVVSSASSTFYMHFGNDKFTYHPIATIILGFGLLASGPVAWLLYYLRSQTCEHPIVQEGLENDSKQNACENTSNDDSDSDEIGNSSESE